MAKRILKRCQKTRTETSFERVAQGVPALQGHIDKWREVNAYLDKKHDLMCGRGGVKAAQDYMCDIHRKIFGFHPGKDASWGIIHARNTFHYQYDGFKREGRLGDLGQSFLQDYKAAMRLDSRLSGYTADVAAILGIVKYGEDLQKKESTMKVAKKINKKVQNVTASDTTITLKVRGKASTVTKAAPRAVKAKAAPKAAPRAVKAKAAPKAAPKVIFAVPATVPAVAVPAAAVNTPKTRDPRIPENGTVLNARYKGREIKITVQKDGFLYGGETYKTLGGAAVAARNNNKTVNGYVFFGLDKKK